MHMGMTRAKQSGAGHGRPLVPAIFIALGLMALMPALSRAGQAAPAAPPKTHLAVLPFTGPAAGVPEGFGESLRQAVQYAVQMVRAVQLVDSGTILGAAQRVDVAPADRLSDEAMIRLGRELGVRGLISGTYELGGETLKVQARVADLGGKPQVLAGEEVAGPLAEFLKGQERLARQTLQQLQVKVTEQDARRLGTALAAQTASVEAYTLYAQAAWQQGLGTREGHDRAIALLTKALEADQNFTLGRYALGISLLATGNRWKASGEIRKAIQINENFAEAHRMLGDMMVMSPRRPYDQAIQAYQKAIALWPDYAEAFVGLGDARAAKGQFDEAIQEYRRALALEPENARVHFGMGKIYYNEKQLYHEAVEEYQRAIALDPKLLEAHLSLGEAYEEKGLYQEAIQRYNHALTIEPKHPMATYGLALAYEKVDTKKAIETWEQYIDLASRLASEKEWLDIARRHLNRLQRGEKPN
jgi:tetratricopeptide (TPR) repeat protein